MRLYINSIRHIITDTEQRCGLDKTLPVAQQDEKSLRIYVAMPNCWFAWVTMWNSRLNSKLTLECVYWQFLCCQGDGSPFVVERWIYIWRSLSASGLNTKTLATAVEIGPSYRNLLHTNTHAKFGLKLFVLTQRKRVKKLTCIEPFGWEFI